MGPGVQWDPVTEKHAVPVHREMCEYTIIPSLPGPIEHQVPLNPRIPLFIQIAFQAVRSNSLFVNVCLVKQTSAHKEITKLEEEWYTISVKCIDIDGAIRDLEVG